MVNFKLFTGSLFQFSSVMAVPTVEESIGVSTIGSEASTGNWTPASRTGATIQFRMTGEKFHGNFPLARLADFSPKYSERFLAVESAGTGLLRVRGSREGKATNGSLYCFEIDAFCAKAVTTKAAGLSNATNRLSTR